MFNDTLPRAERLEVQGVVNRMTLEVMHQIDGVYRVRPIPCTRCAHAAIALSFLASRSLHSRCLARAQFVTRVSLASRFAHVFKVAVNKTVYGSNGLPRHHVTERDALRDHERKGVAIITTAAYEYFNNALRIKV